MDLGISHTMKIRKLLRQNWHEVVVPRQNLYGLAQHSQEIGHSYYMDMLKAWCSERFNSADWHSNLCFSDPKHRKGITRFVFRNPSDALVFQLKWL